MPFAFILSIIIGIGFWIALTIAISFRKEDPDFAGNALGFATGFAIASFIFLVVASYDKVEEYEVGIPISFGSAQDEVGPGIDWHAPWVKMVRMDTRVQELTFNNESRIEAQAQGGGTLNLDLRVQWRIPVEGATEIYRNLGEDKEIIANVAVVPAVRECPRNATTGFTPEGAFTDDRVEIRDLTLECLRSEVVGFGIEIPDIFLGKVDPGQAVRSEIDTKVAVQQQINRAAEELKLEEIELQKQEVNSRQAAVEAFGVSQAEQIVSCGGVPEYNEDGTIFNVTPNEACEDQFPEDYLAWLFINKLDEVDGLTIVTEGLDASLLLPTGRASVAVD